MGNGVSRTYPAGILKTPPKAVSFGKPEVRVVQHDGWETMPLLNTHEVKRIEAKIRSAEMQPLTKPKTIESSYQPIKVKDVAGRRMMMSAGIVVVTGIVCGLAGPFGLIIPVAALTLYALSKMATRRPAISLEQMKAAHKAVAHLEKLASKNQQSGFIVQASMYKNMADDYRKKYRL
jgi:hypothetical protein